MPKCLGDSKILEAIIPFLGRSQIDEDYNSSLGGDPKISAGDHNIFGGALKIFGVITTFS